MKLSKSLKSKIQRKVQRCQILLKNDMDIEFPEEPTQHVAVLNAGLLTGLTLERLLEEIHKHQVTVQDISMIPGKSYCFITFKNCDDAKIIVESMNAVAPLGQNDAVLYLAYCDKVQIVENLWTKPLPDGIFLLPDFISEDEEQILLEKIDVSDAKAVDGSLKHRLVKHFGFEFIYGKNTVDPNSPLDRKIPSEFDSLVFKRLHKQKPEFSSFLPEQMTVNKYEPGQGIPPHVDTHSPFCDPIVSLSLLGDTVMEFRDETRHACLYLPRRSLLVMSGESRYGWTHSITPRMTDVVPKSGGLSMQKRETRVSCTFRQLRNGPCTCSFPKLCDSQKPDITKIDVSNPTCDASTAATLENQNVHQVYNEIASHFSETRHSPWPKVQKFLESFDSNSFLLDIGCGNGKYLNVNPKICMIGCDRSDGLLKVCLERSFNVFQCDCLAVPFKDSSIDGCISIAVIHHLFTDERRKQAIEEMARILRPGGRALIYVWAKNQEADSRKSSYLRQNKENNRRIRKKSETEEKKETKIQVEKLNDGIALPVHTNRTQFAHQDVLVPWKLKGKTQIQSAEETKTFLRYYHVFNEGELEAICQQIPSIKVIESYYDQGNWCVIFEKLAN
ncbi:alkylated DNA repair protein alkB homolog 8 [Culicoides brevitarsis]|uniref:alkylated DNA repair protein alkB homolog 8 n=1 Tax=Culicoides brevitarsis TaxID=469753 RepID=UPI00307CA5BC